VSGVTVYRHSTGVFAGTGFTFGTMSNIAAHDTSSTGINLQGYDSTYANLNAYSCSGYGIACQNERNSYTNLHGRSNSLTNIYFNNVDDSVVSGVSSWAGAQHGIHATSCVNTAFSTMTSFQDAASSSYHGIYFQSCTYGSATSLEVYDPGGHGVYVNSTDQLAFSGIHVFGADVDGLHVDAGYFCTFTSVCTISNTGDGIQFANSPHGHHIDGFSSYNNGGWDIVGSNAVTYWCQAASGMVGVGGSSFGSSWRTPDINNF